VAEAPRQYRGSYELPQQIDSNSSSAKLENGVLTLELVKQQPKSNATSLSVQ
jgi:HSP20 family molecular chaperone IbpA